jgi:hypothetical protein
MRRPIFGMAAMVMFLGVLIALQHHDIGGAALFGSVGVVAVCAA